MPRPFVRFSRRSFLAATPVVAFAAGQQTAPAPGLATPGQSASFPYSKTRAVVSVVKGDSRRKNVHDALVAIDDQIAPVLKRKKYVLLKPNGVTAQAPAACTHADAIRGGLDYLAPRFKGPIVIAESPAAGTAWESYEALRYGDLTKEFRSQQVSLVDLNEEQKVEPVTILDENLHLIPIRLISRLMDPDAYVISLPVAKTHLICVVTLSVKNMVLSAPLRVVPKTASKDGKGPAFAVPWNDKWKIHITYRHANYNMMLVAQRMRPHWGATIIDAFRGMERNGPVSGLDVDHRVAVASTDLVAADRVMTEAMGIKPETVGHLVYCWQAGLGQYDPALIDLRGEKIAAVRKEYLLPANIEPLEEWLRPIQDLPTVVPAL
jgi:uncharacterized protein (DUF362 family)